MNIDWSKAPEGATHYYIRGDTPWRDLSGENWKWWAGGQWNSDNAVHSSIDRSSQGFLERRCAELIARPSCFTQQLEDDLRNKCIQNLHCLISGPGDCYAAARRVYNAGYRKFENVEDNV